MKAPPPSRPALNGLIKSWPALGLALVVPLAVFILRPLGMDLRQSGILAALLFAIICWVTGAVERTLASALLLAVFLAFSGAPVQTVFTFPLSENFLMIVFSFLFSQGISNSGLTEKLLQPLLARIAQTPGRLMASMVVCAAAMIFIIPQPFSRIIILSGIYAGYFDRLECVKRERELKPVLMAGLFIFSVLVNMLMIRGDIILNNALLTMGGVSLTEGDWVRYMSVPTLVFLLLAVVLFYVVFRRELALYHGDGQEASAEKAVLTLREKRCLALILAVVVFWATEGLHGVSGTITVIAGTALMFAVGLLKLPDIKSINVNLLVFLTAAFAIGGVLKACGVADILFSRFTRLFPAEFSTRYVLTVLLTAVILHMVLGSNVTTMSVVVPGLMSIGAGTAPEIPLLLLIYIAVCGHFLLPFHHVVLLLGEGKGYYSVKHLSRFGIPLTILMTVLATVVYMGWWSLLHLL